MKREAETITEERVREIVREEIKRAFTERARNSNFSAENARFLLDELRGPFPLLEYLVNWLEEMQ